MQFKKISLKDDKWTRLVNKSYNYDFYHTLSYNKLEEEEGEPVFFVAFYEDNFIALPLIIREISGSEYFDCTSVYGYAGPISNLNVLDISDEIKKNFHRSLKEFFVKENIISVFSRLHPILENYKFLEGLGEIVSLNKTIAINLKNTLEDQRKQYRKSNKYEINKLKKNNFLVVEATTKKEQDEFIDIYYETMKRVGAKENYFFSRDYFYEFLNNNCFSTKLLIAKKDNYTTAGAIFTITNKVIQYHLAGTKEEFIRDTPMKLILDEARLIGNELNIDFLHLGGGVGGSDEDPLFKFKSGFSKDTFQFKIWKYIVDQEKYHKLVKEKESPINSSFFPLYRA